MFQEEEKPREVCGRENNMVLTQLKKENEA